MAKYFDVKKEAIIDCFIEPKHFFEIPRFQRPYSWEEGNIEEFWETVFTPEPVFLGTIIFNNRRRDDENVVEIIDGQQRYLTIQILAAVIRDICKRLQREFSDDEFDHIAQGITASLLGKPDKWNPKKYDYYLTPGESIRAFFLQHIQKSDIESRIDSSLVVKKNSEEERIKDAYLRFTDLLEEALADEDLDGKKALLKDLLDKKLGKHFFARIEIEDEDLAYEIFETVNAKGVDLNVADLIKNQIFRHVIDSDKKYIDSAKERWLTLTDTVDASGLTMKDFLSYYWSSRYGYVADRKLYKTIRDHFRAADDRWDEFLDDLVENAHHLKNIFTGTIEDIETQTGDYSEAVKVFESLRVLRNSKAKTWSILYLCLFRNLFISDKTGNRGYVVRTWESLGYSSQIYFCLL